MTVRDLIDELECYDEDAKVVLKPSNSTYVDSIGGTNEGEIRSFWGNDFNAVVIYGNEQCGSR